MKEIQNVFFAVFCAGAVSLILELSLLREYVYVFGSTAKSNALVISLFLTGMVIGSYLGTWNRLRSADERGTRRRFVLAQLVAIVFLAVFYSTKRYFIYRCPHQTLIQLYFVLSVIIPSLISGLSYAFSVQIMHKRGEKLTTYIYAFSTVGSVFGSIAHGLIFVPRWGMKSTYLFALLFAVLAVVSMYSSMRAAGKGATAFLVLLVGSVIYADIPGQLFRVDGVLFSKDSQYGLVEAVAVSQQDAARAESWLRGKRTELEMREQPISLRINNMHQGYNIPADNESHEQWATTTLNIVNRKSRVLMCGYGTGVTAATFAASPLVERLDVVENCGPIVEAAKKYFPREHEAIAANKKATLVIEDFRRFVRFADVKYDIIVLDIFMLDYYSSGFYTLEFFNLLKTRLEPDGVIMMLGFGLSRRTVWHSFPFIYQNINPDTIHVIRQNTVYLRMKELPQRVTADYKCLELGLDPNFVHSLVYSDEVVRKPTKSDVASR